jgi:D-alanine-D-alanine ligase
VLVERFVEGTEIHVAVLDGRPLGAIEIDRAGRLWDFAARHSGVLPLHVPPRLSPERLRGTLTLAMRAARALECSGLCEVDLLVSERGNEQVLEVDTQPSLGPQALMPKVAHAAGLGFDGLIEAMLLTAQLHTAPQKSGELTRARVHEPVYGGPERRARPTATGTGTH